MKNVCFVTLFILMTCSIFSQNNVFKFNPGHYFILDYPINIRSQPNLQGEIIGRLYLNNRIEIIQATDKIDFIDNVYSYWYLIKYNEIVGYIFGGFIAVGRLVFDIDRNGIEDYIFFRFSKSIDSHDIIDSYQDLFIYLNNERLSTLNVYRDNPENHYWVWCNITQFSFSNNLNNYYLTFSLIHSKGDGFPGEEYFFTIYSNGQIEFTRKVGNIGVGM
jgi:hypothetical protein